MSDVRGRRFLICHSIVHDLMGSTIVTLDLATHLQESGAEVLVYAAFIGDPAMSLFAERSIRVVDDAGMTEVSFSDFDHVWVNSQVLPEIMVDQLLAPLPETMPSFIFLHMSAIHFAPDEHPYIRGMEERLSSLSLFISPETHRKLLPFFDTEPVTDLYPNPTPTEFSRTAYEPRPAPQQVLIVSNHAEPELMRAKALLAARGLRVRHVGSTGEGQQLVTPEVLAGADVVISIGKTVQYCLVAGRPVYVYDRFGGYGYLDDDRLDLAARRNFSGRGGRELAAEQIVQEICDGFTAAVDFHARRRDEFVRTYSIEHVLPRVLEAVEPREIEPLTTSQHLALRSAQAFGARFFHFWGHNANEVRNREALTRDLAAARAETAAVRDELAASRQEVDALRAEIDRIHGSWTFRTGAAVVRPASSVARAVRRRPQDS